MTTGILDCTAISLCCMYNEIVELKNCRISFTVLLNYDLKLTEVVDRMCRWQKSGARTLSVNKLLLTTQQ